MAGSTTVVTITFTVASPTNGLNIWDAMSPGCMAKKAEASDARIRTNIPAACFSLAAGLDAGLPEFMRQGRPWVIISKSLLSKQV